MVTEALKKRFCKDLGLSIKIFEEPYFSDRLRLMGKDKEWDMLLNMISLRFGGNEEAFLEEYNKLKEKIIEYIKESEAFVRLNSDDMNKYKINCTYRQSDVYNDTNIGESFISIDLSKANFNSLVHYAKKNGLKFFDRYNYQEFIEQFTDIEHFVNSKYIRQVVFGNCNPKRQITYEKYIINSILEKLLETGYISRDMVYSMCSDEVILKSNDLTVETAQELSRVISNFIEIPVKVQYFSLHKFKNSNAYLKEILNSDGTIELVPKCVSPLEAPFVYRVLNGEKPKETDLYFMYEDRLAKLAEYPDISKFE